MKEEVQFTLAEETQLHAIEILKAAAAHLGKLSIRGLVLFGGIYNDVHRCLSRDRRAEANRQQFYELGLHLWIHVQHLHVATTETTPEQEMKRKHKFYDKVS